VRAASARLAVADAKRAPSAHHRRRKRESRVIASPRSATSTSVALSRDDCGLDRGAFRIPTGQSWHWPVHEDRRLLDIPERARVNARDSVGSTSHVGNRFRVSSSATRPSIAPARRPDRSERRTRTRGGVHVAAYVERSGSGNARSSRPALPVRSRTFDPAVFDAVQRHGARGPATLHRRRRFEAKSSSMAFGMISGARQVGALARMLREHDRGLPEQLRHGLGRRAVQQEREPRAIRRASGGGVVPARR